jgi:hypothetical protein
MTDELRYYVSREDYATAPARPDYFVIDRTTQNAVDVSSIEAEAIRYCQSWNGGKYTPNPVDEWSGE